MSYNNSRNDTRDTRDTRRGPRYNTEERYIPRERDDRREEPRREEPRREEPRREDRREEPRRDDRHDDRREEHPSICIPRTFVTIRGEQTKRAVFRTFKELRIGHIERIDTVHKDDKNGEKFCTVYIHMKWNMRSQLAIDTRAKLLDGQEIKIVYDEPWFWKCTMSAVEKPENRYTDRPQYHKTSRPRIDLGEGGHALSRYTQDKEERRDERDEHDEREQHNPEQLCNMGADQEE